MALINCPECNREISDLAKACPHCGYELVETKQAPQSTELEEVKTNKPVGITLVLIGIVGIVLGIFTASMIFGIFVILGGLGVLGLGIGYFKGTQTGTCPYCNSEARMKASDTVYKCPHCKKTSSKSETHLTKIE